MTVYFDVHTHKRPNDDQSVICFYNYIIGQKFLPSSIYTAGVHPCYISSKDLMQFNHLEKIITDINLIAIGECGLDKICNNNWDLQIEVFSKQIQMANQIQKTLIIHCVRAFDEIVNVLKKENNTVPVVFHGINKNPNLLNSLINRGYIISLGDFILRGRHDDFIRKVDLEKILLETDNSSTCIKDIYAYFCQIRNITLEQLKEQIAQNVEDVFNYKIGD